MIDIVPVQEHLGASFHACLSEITAERTFLAHFEAPPLEQLLGFVRANASNDANQFFAVDGTTVVGWADIVPGWAPAVAHTGAVSMGVRQAWRRQGVGERLLQACLDKALAKGLLRIQLEARADNHGAIGLYERLGFRQEALKRRAMRFGSTEFDVVQMSLYLDEPPPPLR